jgi:hypothetical protein
VWLFKLDNPPRVYSTGPSAHIRLRLRRHGEASQDGGKFAVEAFLEKSLQPWMASVSEDTLRTIRRSEHFYFWSFVVKRFELFRFSYECVDIFLQRVRSFDGITYLRPFLLHTLQIAHQKLDRFVCLWNVLAFMVSDVQLANSVLKKLPVGKTRADSCSLV